MLAHTSSPSLNTRGPRPLAAPPSRAEQILRDLPQAMLVLLPDRRLVFANARAEALMEAGHARSLSGRLMSIGPLDALRLEDLLHMAQDGHSARAGLWFPELQTGWMSVSRIPAGLGSGGEWPADSLLLFIHLDEPALTQQARIEALCKQFGLTRTERYVLLLLADGLAAQDVARQLALQVSTIRSHIRNLLGKTHSPSLMQLVRQVGSAEALPGTAEALG